MYQEFWKVQRLDSIAAKEKRCTTYARPRLPDPVPSAPDVEGIAHTDEGPRRFSMSQSR
jgi:hypothetical protein